MSCHSDRRVSGCGVTGLVAVLALLVVFGVSKSAAADSLMGFDFNLSSKHTLEKTRDMGLEILKESKEKDSRKEMLFKGKPPAVPKVGKETETKVVFFGDRIETVTLLARDVDEPEALAVEKFVEDRYGKPDAYEEIFSFTVKSWSLPDTKVVLSRSNGGILKLAQTNLRIRKKRHEREITRKKNKEKRHPVQKMIDGDYSKPDYK